MKIGYARVSTVDQNLDSQIDELKAAGCEKIFADKASGMRTSRPEWDMAQQMLRSGDMLVVTKLDRLGRSMKELLIIIEKLKKSKVGFMSLGNQIDTSTPAGTMVFHVFAAFAEFERSLIVERTQHGLKAARARGRKGGRMKTISDNIVQSVERLAVGDMTISDACKQLNISRSSYYKYKQSR